MVINIQRPRSLRPLFQVDDYIEFHAARILLLLFRCGGEIEGRTKLAKLDFFLRYPAALKKAIESGLLGHVELDESLPVDSNSIESKMIRYRYGPWDPKYPLVIAFLQSLNLIQIQSKETEAYKLTQRGEQAVHELLAEKSFHSLDTRCQVINKTLGLWKGTQLKNFIYQHFDVIAQMPMGQTIDVVEE